MCAIMTVWMAIVVNDDSGHHCLHSIYFAHRIEDAEVGAVEDQVQMEVYRQIPVDEFERYYRKHTRWVADSEVCSPGGSPSDLHDLRSPPTC